MSGWSDPEIIAQMETLADGKGPSDAQFEAALAETERNSRSADPAVRLRGRLILSVLPIMNALQHAGSAEAVAEHLAILTDSIGYLMGLVLKMAGPKIGRAMLDRANEIANAVSGELDQDERGVR